MIRTSFAICFGLAIVGALNALDLPPWLPQCDPQDMEYDACALESSKTALPFILQGDKKYHIPKLTPLEVPEIKISPGDLRLTLTDVKISGLENLIVFESLHWDKKGDKVSGSVRINKLELKSNYKVDGKILVLPIRGEGPFYLSLENCILFCEYPLNWIPQENGSRRLEIMEGVGYYNTTGAHFQLDNLFGDKALSDNMNKVLNENWEAVLKDIGEAVPVTLEAIIRSIVSGLLRNFSFTFKL